MIQTYEARAAAHTASRDAETKLSTRIARLRLASFIPGAALVLWSLGRGISGAPLVIGLALLAAFVVLVVWHARVDARAAWFDALRTVNLHALARIGRAWDLLPPAEPPAPEDIAHHPYAHDLDLFGRASLVQWIGPATTAPGTRTLQEWLLHPATPAQIRARQIAVVELAGEMEWREQLGAHGRLASAIRPTELDAFIRWAEAPGPFSAVSRRTLRVVVVFLTAAIGTGIVLNVAGVLSAVAWMIPVLVGTVLSFATAARVHGAFNRAGAGQHAFARYADLLVHATGRATSAPHLQAIQARLAADGTGAPACLRRLNRILGFAELRASAGIFHFLVQAVTLWDFHVFFALDTWRAHVGPRVRDWMAALGELDALSAFAQIKADNPAWAMPGVAGGEIVFDARELGHPLIPGDRRVANDVVVGPPGTVLLITGSNMSGKSTLLRTIGLNTVLAQAGAPVCASSLRVPPVDLETSMRVQDSLEHGLSYFMAALARLKGVVDRAQRDATARNGRTVMYLLDEILQGTNTAERSIAVRGIARHLLNVGAIGVMTTHDLGIAEQEPLKSAAHLAHFTEIVDAHGAMTFDYRLRPGLATSRNALRLMHLIGIDLEPS